MEQTLTLEEKLQVLQEKMAKCRWSHRYNTMHGVDDILSIVSPMLAELKLSLVLNDTVECKGARYYLKTVARLIDANCDRVIATTGEAEHIRTKNGKDNTQEASEIARYAALTGMFAL